MLMMSSRGGPLTKIPHLAEGDEHFALRHVLLPRDHEQHDAVPHHRAKERLCSVGVEGAVALR